MLEAHDAREAIIQETLRERVSFEFIVISRRPCLWYGFYVRDRGELGGERLLDSNRCCRCAWGSLRQRAPQEAHEVAVRDELDVGLAVAAGGE